MFRTLKIEKDLKFGIITSITTFNLLICMELIDIQEFHTFERLDIIILVIITTPNLNS